MAKLLRGALDGRGLTLASLSFASGSTDVLSFVVFGNVFTSAMTGNTALLAIAVARGHLLPAPHSLMALLGFALGTVLAAALRPRDKRHQAQQGLTRLLLLEIAGLGGCAALWTLSRQPSDESALLAAILLSALGMGVQGVAGRSINAKGVSTIVFTSVLITIVTSLSDTLTGRARLSRSGGLGIHLGSFGAYVAGGLLAAVLVTPQAEMLAWLPVAAVMVALGGSRFMQADEEAST